LNPLRPFLEVTGPLLTHLHTVYMAYSECLPTRLNPLAEGAGFSQALGTLSGFTICSVALSDCASGDDLSAASGRLGSGLIIQGVPGVP
jgi:hypothetical protein